ncbi:MAG: hypothetical protein ACREKI_02200 [Gemmatimonadota bacterium]
MRATTFRPLGFAPLLAFVVSACGGDDGGPGSTACAVTTPYAIGATVNGALANSDCDFGDGTFIDQYRLEAPSQVSVRFSMSSGAFDTFLWIFATGSPGGQVLALHDDIDLDAGNTNSSIHILMSPASYVVGANSAIIGAEETGPYTLTSSFISPNATGCAVLWVTPGVTTSQSLTTNDCEDTGPIYSDEFTIILLFGQSLTVTMTSALVSPHLVLLDDTGTPVASAPSGADATIVYTATDNEIYTIVATSDNVDEVGEYDLTIQVGI